MQVLKYGIFLVIGIAAQACGGGSDGDGGDGGDDDDSGGSSSGSGGSSNGGSSSGKGGTTGKGGSSSGGSATGGSSSGGSSSGSANGGSATGGSATGGTGGIDTTCDMAGYVSILTVPACKEFYTCYIEVLCSLSQGGQACVDSTLATLKASVCYPEGTPLTQACDTAKSTLASQPMFAECAD